MDGGVKKPYNKIKLKYTDWIFYKFYFVNIFYIHSIRKNIIFAIFIYILKI
jgi:hypothetical protein